MNLDRRLMAYLVACVLFLNTGVLLFGAETARMRLVGHRPSVVAGLTATGSLPSTNRLLLSIGLPLRDQTNLDETLRQLYDPASPNYRRFLTSEEFTARFGPTEADYQQVIRFARSHGLTVVRQHSNRVVLDVSGNVSNIQNAFEIRLNTYHHPTQGRAFFAPDSEPSVPTNVPVADMWGLTDYAPPIPLSRQVDAALPLNYNGTGPGGAYQGRDFRNAYVPGVSLTGTGQVAAVVEFDGYYASDITTYEANCGYPNVPLTNILLNVSGTPGYSGQGAGAIAEVTMDIELLIAMAPGLAKLAVYEGNNPYTVFNQITSDNLAKQISCSWAWAHGPSFRWSRGSGSTLDSILSQMAAQGQSFFQASGDSDAYTGTQSVNASTGPIPVDSIYVTSVGGTSLTMNGSGSSWAAETVWNWGNNTGSGGGISPNYAIPSWQANVSMAANGGSTSSRNFPDVALTADAVQVVFNNGSTGIYGGTSCAAPLWAGFVALVNQQAMTAGSSPVGFLNPALYTIAAGANYTNCFHDIKTGNNIGTNTAGLYNAVAGYDLATGLGTPNGSNLINTLAPPASPYITSQPGSQTVSNGANVVFTSSASGQSPLSYQWLFNGSNLSTGGNASGINSNTLTLTAVTSANAGNYSVIVSNAFGSQTSGIATLIVVYPPSFAAQPVNQSIVAGNSAVLSATVNGASPLSYRWRQNGTNVANGSNTSGATSNVLTFAAVSVTNAGSYTLVATNIYGAVTSSVATLTVFVPAAITTAPIAQTIQCGSNASFSVTATGTAPLRYQWSFDGTAITAATNTSLSLTNVHLPDHAISVVVTNLYGSATGSVLLTVQDTLAPVITLNGSNVMYVELGGSFSDPGATASDLCAGIVPVTATGTVDTEVVGTNTISYQTTDGNGNNTSATRTVIVRDTTAPVITWSFTNLLVSADSNCVAAMPDVTGTNFVIATDLSGTLTISQTPTNQAELSFGSNRVVITVADKSGNKAYSTNEIVVRDVTPPVVVLNGASPMLVELGSSFADPGVTAVDECSGVVSVVTDGAVDARAIGTNLIAYTATDASGNTNSVTRLVIVRDTTPPSILWSFTNIGVAADADCTTKMPDVTGTNFIIVSDLSGVVSITQDPTNNASLVLGTNVVVIAITDACGNTSFSTNQITVNDQTPPTLSINGEAVIYVELGSAFTDPGVMANDDCSGIASLATNGFPNTSAVGTNFLTYTAVDGGGNSNSVSRIVVVRDTVPPTISWSFTNLVLAAGADCTATMPDVTGTNCLVAFDLSGPLIITQSPTNDSILRLGSNVVVVAVVDAYENTSYSTNQVVVVDQTAPAITLIGAGTVYVELGSEFIDPGVTASDACSGIAGIATNGVVNGNIVGTNILTYTATDGTGNSNSVSRTVVIRDATPPTIGWSFTNLVLATDSNCTAAMPDVNGTNYIRATDLSEPLTIRQVPTNFSDLPLGTNVVVISVSDMYGNTSYSTNQIVVIDQTPPSITLAGAATIYVELGGVFMDPGVNASDSCSGIASITTNGAVNSSIVGTNSLTYTATDGSGNSTSISRTVIVRDTTAPTIVWSFTNLVLMADSNCVAVMPEVTGTNYVLATDFSGPLLVEQTPANFASLSLGTNVVILSATDLYGNTSYSTNQIVVVDQIPPTITLIGAASVYVEFGRVFMDPGAIASDSCSGIARITTNGAVNTGIVGTNSLTYTATDGSGNSTSISRTVIVRDTTAPTIVWSFTNLVLMANSNCEAVMPDVTGTNYLLAEDLSGPLTIAQTPTKTAILLLGTTTVVIAVADVSGNTAYATNQIIVVDQTPPLIVSHPLSRTNLVGETSSLSVLATACTALSYEWMFNNVVIPGETNSKLVLSNLTVAGAGEYSVVATAAGGATTSQVARLTVNVPFSFRFAVSVNPAGFKDDLILAAALTPTNATGTVQFLTNGTVFDSQSVVAGLASAHVSALPRGTNQLTAIYSGNDAFPATTNSLTEIITNHPPMASPVVYTLVAGSNLNIAVSDLATNWQDLDGDSLIIDSISVSTNGVTVTNTAPVLVYRSLNNVSDELVCTIVDGFGGTNHQTINIVVVPQTNTTPVISGLAIKPGEGVSLILNGGYGSTYILESATDFIPNSWQPVATNDLGVTGVWQFTDPQSTNVPQRFYRLKLVR